MKPLRRLGTLSLVIFTLLLGGCSLFKSGKKPVRIEIQYDRNAFINYGHSFYVKTYLIFSNGKEKNITGKDELTVTCSGGQYYNNGLITLDNYPQKLTSNTVSLKAVYQNGETTLASSLNIPFNYKGDVTLNFSGSPGEAGIKGSNGTTALLFRDGKDGDSGGTGSNGAPGNDITAHIWKDSVDFYYLRIKNLATSKTFIYKSKLTNYGFSIDISGGQGGQGGDGGEGGPGKDGSKTDNKVKEPGNGGNGGSGGMGGSGGKGGSAYVFIHPNAADFQPYIRINNRGGNGGLPGNGGAGGKPGTPLEGQTAASAGSSGTAGVSGYSGYNGDVLQILIEEFDIEY